MKEKNINNDGFTLIEMLVAVSVFAVLAVVSTQILALSLRGVTKSQNLAETRENIDHAALTINRLMNSAKSCTVGSSPFEYQDHHGNDVVIECLIDSNGGYIASDSASPNPSRLTSTRVDIDCTQTSITCSRPVDNKPYIVDIVITGSDTSHAGTVEGSSYISKTRTLIRNYSSD